LVDARADSDARDVKILIVEDNLLNQKILCRFMEDKGYSYSTANNGQEALKQCEVCSFDLIFMDVEMPILNGILATQQIRRNEKWNSVPIIGLSGNVSVEQIQRGLDAGMNDYLKKPYEKKQINQIIEKFMLSSKLGLAPKS
jgi:CheY-like chemotaxis protein